MKEKLTELEKQLIANKLTKEIPDLKCPMCGNNNFIIADGYFTDVIQTDLQILQLDGTKLPTIPIICNKCGFVSSHALGILGLMPTKSNKEEDSDN